MNEIVRFCDGPCQYTKLNFDTIYFSGQLTAFVAEGVRYYPHEYLFDATEFYVKCINCGTTYTLQELDIRYVVNDGWAELIDRRKKRGT